ncbi:MAG TPA: strawberry notch family protein, partial [Planctomycetota bacterium]|nr:strawberry notch family protein [Planctomycetota bacterium]
GPGARGGGPGGGTSGLLGNLNAADQARAAELKASLIARLKGTAPALPVFDPELLSQASELGYLYAKAGVRAFNQWAKAIVSDLGDAFKPYLKSAYLAARNWPGAEAFQAEMTSADEVDEADIQAILEEPAQAEPEEAVPGIYSVYAAKYKPFEGEQPHPSPLVESVAMASVEGPALTYKPILPKKTVTEGKLSAEQIEAIAMAGQAHEQFLEKGQIVYSYQQVTGKTKSTTGKTVTTTHTVSGGPEQTFRQGALIGDGTGAGKGRTICGIIMDNFARGRKKSVWLSKSAGLIDIARGDMGDSGGDPQKMFELRKSSSGSVLKAKEGVLFSTYATLRTSRPNQAGGADRRIDQIIQWLGEDFDGVVIFDEVQELNNSLGKTGRGGRGGVAPSQQATAGMELSRRLPNARVVYLSATTAENLANLAFAERLGLWGKGTQFRSANEFINKLAQGGINAMEVFARDTKQMGLHMARELSYGDAPKGEWIGHVEYEDLHHTLDDEQRKMYDTLAVAWQTVLRTMLHALVTTNNASSQARAYILSRFWSSHQMFFNQIVTAMKVPSLLPAIEKDLKNGMSVAIQFVNTMEAALNRELARKGAEELDELDLTPRDMLMGIIEDHFPTQQYEDYVDDQGNIHSRPVFDSQGKPVQNPDAVEAKNRLLESVASVKIPDAPLDMIINYFGKDAVAEASGRSKRVLRVDDPAKGKIAVVESRTDRHVKADMTDFQDGRKRI